MPHYTGFGTNFSEERQRMSETTPEPVQPDEGNDTNPPAPAPSTNRPADQPAPSDPDAVTNGTVEQEGLPQ